MTLWLLGLCQTTQWSLSPNAAVHVGSTATFTCHTGDNTTCFVYQGNIWDFHKIDVCRKGWDDKFTDRCNVTTQRTEGTVTLTISDVRLSDAGFYSCGDCFNPTKVTTHLLVLGKN